MLKPLQKVRRPTPFEVHIETSESECEMAGERLLRAVLSFYREEADDLARLEPLLSCRPVSYTHLTLPTILLV